VPIGLQSAGVAFQSPGAALQAYGHKKQTAGVALKSSGGGKLKSGFPTGICKETRNSFNNTKNNPILPLDRILGFYRIYYHSFRRGLRGTHVIQTSFQSFFLSYSLFSISLQLQVHTA
jgi:hypothetical protein